MAGAAALVLRGARLDHIQLIQEEQRRARGNYPGPLPIICEPDAAVDAAVIGELAGAGVAAIVLPPEPPTASPSAPPLPVVPRCESDAELRTVLTSVAPPPLVFAAVDGMDATDGAAAAPPSSKKAPVVMASLRVGEDMAARARSVRARGCCAVVVDFDADDWPCAPETLVGAVLSKKSPVISSLGVQNNAYGTFTSEQFWMNKKFKAAREKGKQRELKYGSSNTDAASGGGGGGGAGGAEAGSKIAKVS